MRGARILAMATMTAAAVVLPNSQAFAVVDVNVAQNGRSVTVTASSEVCQAPGAMVNANAFPSGLLRNALALNAASPGGPLTGTFTIPEDAPANTYTITVSCMIGPKSDQGSVGTLTVPATTSTTGDRDGGTNTDDPVTVPDDNDDDEYGDDYEDDYGNYGRGHGRDKCSWGGHGRGGHGGRGDDRGGHGGRGDDQGDDDNGRGGYGDRGGNGNRGGYGDRGRDHDRKCYKKRHHGYGRDNDRDNDNDNDYGAPDTGFGGSTGMNTAESLTGASLLAATAAGGVFLLRRRRTQGGEA